MVSKNKLLKIKT